MCWAAEFRGVAEACQGPAWRHLLWRGLCACWPVLFLSPTGEASNMISHSHNEESSQPKMLTHCGIQSASLAGWLAVCLPVCLAQVVHKDELQDCCLVLDLLVQLSTSQPVIGTDECFGQCQSQCHLTKTCPSQSRSNVLCQAQTVHNSDWHSRSTSSS